MGTRATFSFRDEGGTFHVYKHWDGYPTGAAQFLDAAIKSDKTWTLPRFEADEFAAGFIATNKDSDGDIRLTRSPRAHCDIEFAYTVWQAGDGNLMIRAQSVNNWDKWKAKTIWRGKLSEFIESGAADWENAE